VRVSVRLTFGSSGAGCRFGGAAEGALLGVAGAGSLWGVVPYYTSMDSCAIFAMYPSSSMHIFPPSSITHQQVSNLCNESKNPDFENLVIGVVSVDKVVFCR
jgi:hypothetical protein